MRAMDIVEATAEVNSIVNSRPSIRTTRPRTAVHPPRRDTHVWPKSPEHNPDQNDHIAAVGRGSPRISSSADVQFWLRIPRQFLVSFRFGSWRAEDIDVFGRRVVDLRGSGSTGRATHVRRCAWKRRCNTPRRTRTRGAHVDPCVGRPWPLTGGRRRREDARTCRCATVAAA